MGHLFPRLHSRAPRPIKGPITGLILAATVAAFSGRSLPARAQQIDQYLYPAISGTAEQQGVTVTSRERPEYEFSGINLGGFIFRPELDETTGYDDNVTGTPHAHGSAVFETNASLQGSSNWSRNSLGFDIDVDDYRYPEQSSQSYTNFNASLGGTYDIGRDTVNLSFTHLDLTQTARDLGVPALDHPITYHVEDAQAGYKANFNRLSLQPNVDVADYDFDNGTVNGQPYLQSYRDRVVVSPSLTANYEFAPLHDLVLVLKDAEANYPNRAPGLAARDFSDVSALAGINDGGGIISLRLLAGYEVRHFSSSEYKTISAPVAEASVIYNPTGLTTLTANASRTIEDAAADVTAGYTETAFSLRIDHEYLRNVLLNAQAGLYLDDYAAAAPLPGQTVQGGSHQTYATAGAGVTWLMNRHMRLVLSYDYATRRSPTNDIFVGSTPLQYLGASYSENQILLQLKVSL